MVNSGKIEKARKAADSEKLRASGDLLLTRNLAAMLSLAAVFSGSLVLSAQSVGAKNARNISHKDRNYLVPPPPPYTPSIVPMALGLPDEAQTLTIPASDAAIEKQVDLYRKYLVSSNNILRHNKSEIPQVGQPHTQVTQPNPYMTFDPKVEKKAQKQAESFDSEISKVEKEIGKLLNLY